MGLRKYKREIAKDRMRIMGIPNRKMKRVWRRILSGKTGADAERVQMNYGKILKASRSRV